MIMHKAEFKAKRNTYSYRQIIHARPDVVFPLLCPVREAEWLDGWDYKMIYSESGVVEEGAEPVLSVPLVDFEKLEDPSIIDAF